MNAINRNNSIMEPYDGVVEEALSNLHSKIVNPDPFGQQKNDDIQEELADGNNILDGFKNVLDETIFLDEMSSLPTYTTPNLIPDLELNAMIGLLNDK